MDQRPLLESGRQRAPGHTLVEPLNDCAVNGEAGTSEWTAVRTRDQAIVYEGKDLEFFTNLTSVALADRILRPLKQLGVPRRAVIQRIRRYSADHIVRTEAICQVRGQALPLWIRTVVGAIGGDEDALNRTGESIVTTQV